MHEGPTPVAPRPKAVHLIAWIAGCAVGLATYRAFTPPFNEAFRPIGLAYDTGMGTALGTILAGYAVLADRRRRGERADPEPTGHALLAFGLIATAANLIAIAAYYGMARFYFRYSSDGGYPPVFWSIFRMADAPTLLDPIHHAIGWFVGLVATVAFAWCRRRELPRAWLAVFVAFALTSAVLSFGASRALLRLRAGSGTAPLIAWCRVGPHTYAALVSLCAATILIALVDDRRRRRAIDGPHLAGVAAWLMIAAIQISAYVRIIRM